MFPLLKRKIGGYTFGQPTFYSSFHLGTDYQAKNDNLYAPFDGVLLRQFYGHDGGNTIWFRPNHDDVIIRFMHLSRFLRPQGKQVKQGEKIAITGNTGITTKPHLHLDISKHSVQINNKYNFIDPEKYDWVYEGNAMYVKKSGDPTVFVLAQGKIAYPVSVPWQDLQAENPDINVVTLSPEDFASKVRLVSKFIIK